MKNKFIILTLCFTIIFSNINLNNYKSYANNYQPLVIDGGVISAPMVATVATLAVASGIALSSNDDVYDIVKVFYEKHKSNWEDVQKVFDTCVSIGANKVVTVGKEFLELVKSAFDDTFVPYDSLSSSQTINVSTIYGLPDLTSYSSDFRKYIAKSFTPSIDGFSFGGFDFVYNGTNSNNNYKFDVIYNGNVIGSSGFYLDQLYKGGILKINSTYYITVGRGDNPSLSGGTISLKSIGSLSNSYDLPYTPGSYAPGGVLDKDNVGINVPSNVGDLVGVPPGDILGNPSFDLPSDGSVTLPGVSNPSLGGVIDGTFNPSLDTDIPGDVPSDVPSEGLFASIKDFIISLVVPSDTFWTDTFNGFRDNFSNNFPMLDMSKFDSLAVGGKPFPNLYAYDSKIVDGDVINSIVDWLRPIIAGFIMICLMFFNYRKIYKLIRNTEPFGGIAQGSSDFRTGLSAPPINNGLDSNPMGNLRDTLFDMRNEILRRENEK